MESISLSKQTSMVRHDNNTGEARTRGSNNPLCRAFKWIVNNKVASSFMALGLISASGASFFAGLAIGSRSVKCLSDNGIPPGAYKPIGNGKHLAQDVKLFYQIKSENLNSEDACWVHNKYPGGSESQGFGPSMAHQYYWTQGACTDLPLEVLVECNNKKVSSFLVEDDIYRDIRLEINKNSIGEFNASFDGVLKD